MEIQSSPLWAIEFFLPFALCIGLLVSASSYRRRYAVWYWRIPTALICAPGLAIFVGAVASYGVPTREGMAGYAFLWGMLWGFVIFFVLILCIKKPFMQWAAPVAAILGYGSMVFA